MSTANGPIVMMDGSGTYASRMRSRARRDSMLAGLRGGEFTAEHLRTAFRDSSARLMVAGARQGRLRQDSALISYDVHSLELVSIGAKATATGRERVLEKTETASRIRWTRGKGVVIDGEGFRTSSGILGGTEIGQDMAQDATSGFRRGAISIPYYTGREELWLGSTSFGFNENARVLLHPFEEKAEAHYTYATGDSSQIIMPDGTVIRLRELRVTPRKAHWTLIVGSFWFDEANYRLVRAAYRPSEIVDAFQYAEWADGGWNGDELTGVAIARALLTPFRATISAITIEYGLFGGRFWLPRQQTATGEIRASFVHFPVEIVQKFDFASVNSSDPTPVVPVNTSYVIADSLWRLDSLAYHGDSASGRIAAAIRARVAQERRDQTAAAAAARRADTTRRNTSPAPRPDAATIQRQMELLRQRVVTPRPRAGCTSFSDSGSTVRLVRNGQTRLDMLVRIPCNDSLLANSSRLPAASTANSDDALKTADMSDLVQRLGMALQAGWGFRLPQLRYGFGDSLTRYNRVEGLSPALGVREVVGRGFALDALGRIGTAGGVFEGELSLARSNVRQNLQLTMYRRLNSAGDWGDPFTLGASLQALVFGRDEGFYYRSRGISFVASTPGNPNLQMKLYAERQLPANADARFSLAHAFGGGAFGDNIIAERGEVFGASLQLSHSLGLDPAGFRVFTRARAENAMGDFTFGRGLLDMTFSQGLFGVASAAITLSAGSSTGSVPPQRLFLLGGSHTIRGQRAGVASGDAFWMGRAELGTAAVFAKPVLFADFGWAGSRDDWRTPGRPLSGAGVGASFFDGLIRFDLARGIYPGKKFRFAMYLDAKF